MTSKKKCEQLWRIEKPDRIPAAFEGGGKCTGTVDEVLRIYQA